LLAHLVWEGVLVLLALAVTVLGIAGHVFIGQLMWPQLATVGVLAAGLALSLRTGTPNLAVASIAELASVLYVLSINRGSSAALAAVLAILGAFALGVVLALVTGLTGAPAWAVSLGGVAIASTIGLANAGPPRIAPLGTELTVTWFAIVAVLFLVGSVAAGLLWLIPGLRNLRATADDGSTVGVARRLVAALIGLGVSSLLAGVVGVLTVARFSLGAFTGNQLPLLIALGAVLLGGASLTGRGGGIAGTALSVYLVVTVTALAIVHSGRLWTVMALPATVAIIIGIPVSRLLDWIGARPAAAATPPALTAAVPSSSTVDSPQ
jgi:ribose/xylose/arabinose/galactoside ABC-type transport system permease subunit